jgi:hypothetical protein
MASSSYRASRADRLGITVIVCAHSYLWDHRKELADPPSSGR